MDRRKPDASTSKSVLVVVILVMSLLLSVISLPISHVHRRRQTKETMKMSSKGRRVQSAPREKWVESRRGNRWSPNLTSDYRYNV